METVIAGFAGFIAAFIVFAIGFVFGRKTAQPGAPVRLEMSDVELEQIKKQREALEAEQNAFLDLCGYNADVAYGLTSFPIGGES